MKNRKMPGSHRRNNAPIVQPVVPKNAPEGGKTAVMVGSRTDLFHLLEKTMTDPESGVPLFFSRLYGVRHGSAGWYLVGPMVGAPYAVMILETLIAMGVKRILFYGWCGAVSRDLHIGDILLPSAAVMGEGTSRHYRRRGQTRQGKKAGDAEPSEAIQAKLRNEIKRRRMPFFEGPVWTTDAIFRETPRKTVYYQRRGVSAVEMETAALFSAGRFHDVAVGSIMVVSDEIASLTWVPGFKTPRFKSARHRTCEVIQSVCPLR